MGREKSQRLVANLQVHFMSRKSNTLAHFWNNSWAFLLKEQMSKGISVSVNINKDDQGT